MKMPNNKVLALILFFLLIGLGLSLFLSDKISSNHFMGWMPITLAASFSLYWSEKLKAFTLSKGHVELFEARDDIREYMFEVYELQLSSIVSADEMSIPVKESKARSFDVYMDIYTKANKHEIVDRLREKLTVALAYVMKKQEFLLQAYSQHRVEDTSGDIEDRIKAYVEQANFETASNHLGNTEGGMTVEEARQFFNESLNNMRALQETRIS